MNDVQRTKLRLAIKVGIFYFQYTLLKQFMQNVEEELPLAPRGYVGHEANEPRESAADLKFKELSKHNQPQKALEDAVEPQS